MCPGSVPCTHVPVALGDGSRDGEVPVLAVHVVSSGPGVVLQPDSEVFDLERLPLPDLLDRHDLTSSLLELPSCLKKYQKRDLATIWSVAKILILERGVTGSLSVGSFLPMTRYSLSVPLHFIVSLVEVNQARRSVWDGAWSMHWEQLTTMMFLW